VPSHEVNIDGTFNVLRAAREGQAGRVVYAASSSAYGDTEVLPKVETMTPRPKSPYALQKLVGEYYCAVFSGVYGLETVALRYFNVYGPRQDPSSPYSGVLSLFMKAILERRAPTIFGDGEQSRDFTYVEDVAELNLKAARRRRTFRARSTTAATAAGSRSTRRGRCYRRWKEWSIPPNFGLRARAMCAIRRPIPRRPCATWATPRGSRSKRACGGRWSGTARAAYQAAPLPGLLGRSESEALRHVVPCIEVCHYAKRGYARSSLSCSERRLLSSCSWVASPLLRARTLLTLHRPPRSNLLRMRSSRTKHSSS
jgi:hypothetical protein